MENNFCAKCGAKLEENAKFCIKCGNMVYINPQPVEQYTYVQPPVTNYQPEYVQPPIIQQTPVIPPIKTASWWLTASIFFGAFLVLALVCFVI